MTDNDRLHMMYVLAKKRPDLSFMDIRDVLSWISRALPRLQRMKEAPCVSMSQECLKHYESSGASALKGLALLLAKHKMRVSLGSGDPRGSTIELYIGVDDGTPFSTSPYLIDGEGFTADDLKKLEATHV